LTYLQFADRTNQELIILEANHMKLRQMYFIKLKYRIYFADNIDTLFGIGIVMTSSIDRQQSILQSNIMERIQQVQQQHPDMQQRYFENHLSQERIKKLHKVNDYDDMEQIHFRDREEKGQHKHQQRKSDTEKLQVEISASQDEPGRINIKI